MNSCVAVAAKAEEEEGRQEARQEIVKRI